MIVQKLKRNVQDDIALAEKYYSILSDVNSLNLTTREIQLIAFTAVRGNITNANVREEFCTKHNTTKPTINNIISKLKKVGVFVKEKNMVKVNPVIVLDFNKDVFLAITLKHDDKQTS
jgi:DNA-binding MarR family transcriptional regulator